MSQWQTSTLFDSAYSTVYSDLQRLLIRRLWARARQSQAIPNQGSDRFASANRLSPTTFDKLIEDAARRHNVDAELVRAVIKVESNFDPNAVSYAGAKGLMQLMDGTAAAQGVEDSFDPVQNIEGGVAYLAQQLRLFRGNTRLALAAYNAGPGTVQRYGGVPPIAETQAYVQRVLDTYQGDDGRRLDVVA